MLKKRNSLGVATLNGLLYAVGGSGNVMIDGQNQFNRFDCAER